MQTQSVLNDQAEKDLWRAWIEDKDVDARQKLIEHHLPFSHMLAAKFYAKRQILQIEFDEYRQYAIAGMIEAIDRFDIKRESNFRTYAGYRITGAILNGIEKYSDKQQQISTRTLLRQQRIESMQEADGKDLGIDIFSELVELAVGLAIGYMLEDSGMYQTQEDQYTENFYERHELKQLQKSLEHIVDVLPEQSRRVIRYHYYQGLSFEHISDVLKLSKGRISQIHSRAIKLLREVHLNSQRLDLSL